MSRTDPRVVIGLPVFNGENFLSEAIESILGQSFSDLKLIISDNCSTDGTPDIIERYRKADQRIVAIRQDENIGGAPNYNAVFRPQSAPYFKWAAHDDVLEVDYLKETVSLLEADPGAVIAHGRTREIDETGSITGTYDTQVSLRDATPVGRFRRILWAEYFTEVFGLMRSSAIASTRMHGSFAGSDRNFMVEMVLRGNVSYVDAYIFQRRNHPDAYVRRFESNSDRQAWFDPNVRLRVPPGTMRAMQYVQAIAGAPIPTIEKCKCLHVLLQWAARRTHERLSGVRGSRESRLFEDPSNTELTSLRRQFEHRA